MEISAADAVRRFAAILDAVERSGESFTIVRRGKPIARLKPIPSGRGAKVKKVLRNRPADPAWSGELASMRDLLRDEHRQ
ncbi:MAG TPA: type II toxin-antitoxin system prevent-host-death family antitoxin [Acidimicrobiales bacterium]|nr:type II toxin-antitoxin system prevent-host-death family antitoxin [Acidimicrobiales bacterium]